MLLRRTVQGGYESTMPWSPHDLPHAAVCCLLRPGLALVLALDAAPPLLEAGDAGRQLRLLWQCGPALCAAAGGLYALEPGSCCPHPAHRKGAAPLRVAGAGRCRRPRVARLVQVLWVLRRLRGDA